MRSAVQQHAESRHGRVVVPALDPDFAHREAQLRVVDPGVVFGHCRVHGWNAVRDTAPAPTCPMCLAAREVNRDNTEYVRRLFA
jgi:hypothetical protein